MKITRHSANGGGRDGHLAGSTGRRSPTTSTGIAAASMIWRTTMRPGRCWSRSSRPASTTPSGRLPSLTKRCASSPVWRAASDGASGALCPRSCLPRRERTVAALRSTALCSIGSIPGGEQRTDGSATRRRVSAVCSSSFRCQICAGRTVGGLGGSGFEFRGVSRARTATRTGPIHADDPPDIAPSRFAAADDGRDPRGETGVPPSGIDRWR